ncbi:MAG: RNA polymerase sigma factor [Planctomycetes bacterium]|nr:RNA polymerase sigma factor [Planctomycetota bacterium]
MASATRTDPVLLASYQRAVHDYADLLKSFAARLLADDADWAEDVAQDALLALYRHLHDVPESAWRPWLYRVTRNLCLDRLRRRKHRPKNFRDFADEENRDPVPPSRITNRPEIHAQEEEMQRDLEKAIAELPPRFREVFLLCEQQGVSYEEASTILDVPLKTISTRLFRARQRLMKAMASHLED